MSRIYDFYERRVFPHVLELAMRQLGKLRAPTLAGAHGEVLEIGFGTGLNLPHYPAGVAKLATADPMEALPGRVRERIEGAAVPGRDPPPARRPHAPVRRAGASTASR